MRSSADSLNKLLLLPGVALLATKSTEHFADRKHAPRVQRLDVLRIKGDYPVFVVVSSRDGEITNYASYYSKKEAFRDLEHDSAPPVLPLAALKLLDPAAAKGVADA